MTQAVTPQEEPERKLAALMAADVVGFSRMVGQDEAGTLARLDAARRDVIDPLLCQHRGRTFKVMGDGALVEFPSVVLALRAALAVQAALRERNASLPAGHRIVLRVGIHQADVVVQGSDLLGEGVSIAARLERLSAPGGICISDRVREDAGGKVALLLRDGGEQALHNIDRSVRVFHILLHPGAHGPPDGPRGAGTAPAAHDRAAAHSLPVALPAADEAAAGDGERTIAFAPAPSLHVLVLLGGYSPLEAPQDGAAASRGQHGGQRHGREVPFGPAPTILGRMPPSDVILPGDGVSRAHCRIELADGVAFVTDLHSTNGTFVDDRRIGGPVRLRPGALLRIGPHVLRYVRLGEPADGHADGLAGGAAGSQASSSSPVDATAVPVGTGRPKARTAG